MKRLCHVALHEASRPDPGRGLSPLGTIVPKRHLENAAFTIASRSGPAVCDLARTLKAWRTHARANSGDLMASQPFVADISTWEDASHLMNAFGDAAVIEASARADRSRDVGNMQDFCRWRQIERLIMHLADNGAAATLH